MKMLNAICFLFLLAMPILTFAQQTTQPTAPQPVRTPSPEELAEMRKAEIANFKNYVFRFETAWAENDLQSMSDIRAELVKLMEKEIKQTEEKALANENLKALVETQKAKLTKLKNSKLSTANESGGKTGNDSAKVLYDFITLMEQ